MLSKSYRNKYEPVDSDEFKETLFEPHRYKLFSVDIWEIPFKLDMKRRGAVFMYNFFWSKSKIFILRMDFFEVFSDMNNIFLEYLSILYLIINIIYLLFTCLILDNTYLFQIPYFFILYI